MKANKTHHHAVMNIQLHTDELELIDKAAEFYGKDVLTFMREAALRAAQQPWVKITGGTLTSGIFTK